MKNGMFKQLLSLTLSIGLLLSLCSTSVLAQEVDPVDAEAMSADLKDSGNQELPPDSAVLEEETLDIEALLPQFEGDREALIEEVQELHRQAQAEEEAYLSQFSEKELREMEERMEETRRAFAEQAEAAAAAYEQPDSVDYASSRAARNYSIASGSIAIQDGTNAGTIKITQGSSVANNLNPGDTPIVITGTSDKNYVVIATSSNRTVNLTMTGLNMNNLNADTVASCISLSNRSVVNLTVSGSNRIFAQQGGAGIEVPEGAKLTIAGTGTLAVTGGSLAAAIGGYSGNGNCGIITMNSSTIIVDKYALDSDGENYGGGGAGIGGGYAGGVEAVIINGGKITINEVFSLGAGIGGGGRGNGGNVTINGGVLLSTVDETLIGSGYKGTIDSVNINGGNITALQSSLGAAIGSSSYGNVNTIKITKGTINVLSSSGAGIGAGNDGGCGSITITGGDITAKSDFTGAGIGGGDTSDKAGYQGACGSISISNATVHATGYFGAGIGGGGSYEANGGTVPSIHIASGTVTAVSESAAAIGGGYGASGNGADGTINIGSSAKVTAISGETKGAINNNAGTANILNFRMSVPVYYGEKAVLKNASGSAVYTMGDPGVFSYGSLALAVPAGNYTLHINNEKQLGTFNNAFTATFNAAKGIKTYMNVRPDLPAEQLYGRLGFAYPLPSEWTGHYKYYTGHAGSGLDLNAPGGTPIYSVDAGDVMYAGRGGNNSSAGYFLAIKNHTYDPTKVPSENTKLITRYLHLESNPIFDVGDPISRGQVLGGVGKTGNEDSYQGNYPVNHLHIDFNSSGYKDNIPENVGIRPFYFWPGVNFHLDETERSLTAMECDYDFDNTQGQYYDSKLIRIIGNDQFESWYESTPENERSAYKLIEDFGLTWEELREQLHSSVYDIYWNNKPQ